MSPYIHYSTEIIVGYGRQTIMAVLDADYRLPVQGAVAVIDGDYTHLIDPVPTRGDLVVTEATDLDALIFFSDAYDKFYINFCDETKVSGLVGAPGDAGLRREVTRISRFIGALRLVSSRDDHGVTFSYLKYDDILATDLIIDYSKAMRHLVGVSRKSALRILRSQILSEALSIANNDSVPSQLLCRGHDLLEVLATLLRRRTGCLRGAQARRAHLERIFAAVLDEATFSSFSFTNSLIEWSDMTGYPVFSFPQDPS